MLYTPIHLKLYRACGIDTISLYYSALPFNGFSAFVPPLTFTERYNPLTLDLSRHRRNDDASALLQHRRPGGSSDLRRWVKQMRQQQLALSEPSDALLLIDMDADDEFWVGFDVPLLKGRLSTASGLRGLVENVADLDYREVDDAGRLPRRARAGGQHLDRPGHRGRQLRRAIRVGPRSGRITGCGQGSNGRASWSCRSGGCLAATCPRRSRRCSTSHSRRASSSSRPRTSAWLRPS